MFQTPAQQLGVARRPIQASRRLGISGYTVTDHVKSIFEKVGARTQGELSATLFFGEHLPRIENRVPVGDDRVVCRCAAPATSRGVAWALGRC